MYKMKTGKDFRTNSAPFYTKEKLEVTAWNILKKHDKRLLESAMSVPIENIIENQYNLPLEYQHLSTDESILGLTTFDGGHIDILNELNEKEKYYVGANTIIIESALADDRKKVGRYRFTCSHELAHYILHRRFFELNSLNANYVTEDEEITGKLEWQANFLGAALIMPARPLRLAFYENVQNGMSKEENIRELCSIFDVTKSAMKYRIEELHLVHYPIIND